MRRIPALLVAALLAAAPASAVAGPSRETTTSSTVDHFEWSTARSPLGMSVTSLTPELRTVFVINVLLSMAWDLNQIVIPVYGNDIGLSASAIGLILASFGAATFELDVFDRADASAIIAAVFQPLEAVE